MIETPELEYLSSGGLVDFSYDGLTIGLKFSGTHLTHYDMSQELAYMNFSEINDIVIYGNGQIKIYAPEGSMETNILWLWSVTAAPVRHTQCKQSSKDVISFISETEDENTLEIGYEDGLTGKVEISYELINGTGGNDAVFDETLASENYSYLENILLCLPCVRRTAESNFTSLPGAESYKDTIATAMSRIDKKKKHLKATGIALKIASPVAAAAGGTATALLSGNGGAAGGSIAAFVILLAGGSAIVMNKKIEKETETIEKEWQDFAEDSSFS